MTGVLGRYLAGRYARAVLGVFAAVLGLIFTLDFVDTLRRAGEVKGASGPLIAWLAVLHTPIVAEQALPFVVLIGAMTAFLNLSRRLELAVARSAGLSVWQFLSPALVVALLLGAAEVAAFNPLSTAMKRHAAGLEAKLFGSAAREAGGFWLRQKTSDGQRSSMSTAAISRRGFSSALKCIISTSAAFSISASRPRAGCCVTAIGSCATPRWWRPATMRAIPTTTFWRPR